MPPELIPVLIVFTVIGIPVICGTLVKLAKIMRGDEPEERRSRRDTKNHPMSSADETELIQQIHQSLNRLESRIESIETIVLDSETKKPTAHHEQ